MADFNEDLCMRNSYELLLGKKTMDQLVDKNDVLKFNSFYGFACSLYDYFSKYYRG